MTGFSSASCNSQEILLTDSDSAKIDSLIEILKLNEHCLLVKFGYDAVTAIETKKGIVVIDAGISTGLAFKYRQIVEKEFGNKDFVNLIITHFHPDHYGGESVFPESKIIGQANSIQEISESEANPDKKKNRLKNIVKDYDSKLDAFEPNSKDWIEAFTQKIRYLMAYNDVVNNVPVRKPEILFKDSLDMDMENVTFELLCFGSFHSMSDILIYLPELKILFVGDLFSRYGRPSSDSKLKIRKAQCFKSVNWLEKRMNQIEKIVTGHGEILSADDLKTFNQKLLKQEF
jgi:glyoxylase-like metal-dependent hydrolase (beta-lactamase superfamily II)